MIKNLVIVESPAKAKTIEKFLGKDYKVMSSYGHIRDLKKRDFALGGTGLIDPEYEIPEDKKDLVKNLAKAAKDAEMVWLASDEDREGEAIAWHLFEVLNLKPENTRRIVFHEITKNAILNALANPREIDLNLVDAQQARRVLDRIVGFELSPVLWKKIKPSLSAGRVQSVAVRLIVEREKEIKNFNSEPYYRVSAIFATPDGAAFKAELSRRLDNENEAKALIEKCSKANFTISDITVRPVKKSPAPPFTTSTLQQEAARKLGFPVSLTMMVAQKLYEAGFITYMRTDSFNLSQLAIGSLKKEITDTLGERYLQIRHYHTKSKGAQEAHEAIRPTYVDKVSIVGNEREQKLYELIRKRTIASQMADAEIEKTTIEITGDNLSEHFTAVGEIVKFDGFMHIYKEESDEDALAIAPGTGLMPSLKKGEAITPRDVVATERWTLAPARYTEASLVKKMEELGIGRPSTYAPTISTILTRGYVDKGDRQGEPRNYNVITLKDAKITKETKTENVGSDRGKLIPTDTGIIVNEFLTEHFPNVLDYNFTANVEERFDLIAEGQAAWKGEISSFYDVFHPEVVRADEMRLEHKVGERLLGVDPVTGKNVSVKIGRFGPVVQLGDTSSDEKPHFAPLRKDQSVFDLKLEDALKLFELPRTLGTFEDSEVTVAVGRFGPYVKHAGKFVSIPKTMQPTTITLEDAEELIRAKREADSKKVVKTFSEEPDLQILNGRYGVYIAYKKANYKIPKTVSDPSALTLEECRDIIAAQDAKPKAKRTTRRSTTSR